MTQWRTLDPSLVFDVGSVAVAWLPRWLGHKKKRTYSRCVVRAQSLEMDRHRWFSSVASWCIRIFRY
jgi:hypothetical protein